MQLLLSFLKVIIAVISFMLPSNIEIKQLMDSFPTSLNAMRTRFNIEEQQLVQYVMCPKCDHLCGDAKALILCNQQKCTHIPFPNHPHQSRRTHLYSKLSSFLNDLRPCHKKHTSIIAY